VALYRQFLSQQEEPEEEGGEVPKPVDPMENALAAALIDHALINKYTISKKQTRNKNLSVAILVLFHQSVAYAIKSK
jgi:hypothetical protein